jgi:hypothetical protein
MCWPGLVNFFNPSHIFIGGGIANFGNHLLIAIKRAVLRRSLPLATTNLAINFSRIGSDAGIIGAIMLALEYLFVVEDDLALFFLDFYTPGIFSIRQGVGFP